jgi:RNA polymerase-binding protein DksA
MADSDVSRDGRSRPVARRAVAAAASGTKAPAKKATVKKATAKKATVKKAAAKKAEPKKASVTKAMATKAEPKKAAAKKAEPKKASVTKAMATKAEPKKATAKIAKAPATKAPATKTATVPKQAAKKTTPKASTTKAARPRKAAPAALKVRAEEDPWTDQELAEVRGELLADVDRLRAELSEAEVEMADLLRDFGDGAGEDQADAGSKTFEREQEMSLANNSRDMLLQAERALGRIDDGSYGVCESCGNPIGKARLQAFPRATLCVACKQREERR